MRIAIIQLFGSCNTQALALALKRAGLEPVVVLPESPPAQSIEFAGFVLIGDFYHNALLTALDPIIQLTKQQNALGKPILGIAAGAQLLVEAGLLPGVENDIPCIKVMESNTSTVYLRLAEHYQLNAFTHYLTPKNILASGASNKCFSIPPALFMEMELLGANVFQFCDESGKASMEDCKNVSAISNKVGNMMAILPQMEFTEKVDPIFQSMRDYIQEGYVQRVVPLNYYPR